MPENFTIDWNVALVNPPEPFMLQQWDYLLSSFPAQRLWLIGDAASEMPKRSPLSKAERIKTAAELPSFPLVVLAPKHGQYCHGDVSLLTFEHPNNAIYLFGSDALQLSEDQLSDRVPDYKVFIPTATRDDLYSWVAAGIVVWDKVLKRG